MIIHKTMSDGWLSNTWLVGDEPGGHAVLIDTGGPMDPIVRAIEQHRLTVTHVLCTHHHIDHVQHNSAYKRRLGCPICGHHSESELFGGLDLALDDGDELVTGGLHLRVLHTPGHTRGMLAFVVNDERLFTGDTLFRRTVGGTRAPGHTSFEDLHHSIMDVLMKFPKGTKIHPGHTDVSTVGEEWEENPFIRMWRGVDRPGERRCTAFGEPATLLLRARDYDGGSKCWVRFDDGGKLDVVPGSQVRTDDGM
ncbi:MAG TPA: MBL fold metallo-hydrolase [Candidatus Polarisedimenticolaceae bacterium]|nr:MBL fold metallo-hydrolase [Candidatus Polarisedimenticolaceae bacterium]